MCDPLSDVLKQLSPQIHVSAGLSAAGDWSLSFPAHEGIKFNAVVKGQCWVEVEESEHSSFLQEGDCFLLTTGRAFRLTTDQTLRPLDSQPLYAMAEDGIACCNGGGDFFLVGARVSFIEHASMLLRNLPPIVRIPASADQSSVLRWGLGLFASEVKGRRPGGNLVTEHLAHIMLIQALRQHIQNEKGPQVGWFYALDDKQVGSALNAIHSDVAYPWTLSALAKVAGMSRSAFAMRFRSLVGNTPMDYLTHWRMLTAAQKLREHGGSVASISEEVGYSSESAFRVAFKRTMQALPKEFRLNRQSNVSKSHE